MGGKYYLAKAIVPRIPPHHTYVEPFCGGAWIFFSKPPSKVEVLNDLDGELVNFWRVIQNHLEEFIRCCEFMVVSRRLFALEKLREPAFLTEIQRAVRYYYLQGLCYGGRPHNRTFSTSIVLPSRLRRGIIREELENLHRRMRGIYLENLDACECIRRWDRPETFFYLDPPYWGLHEYAHRFDPEDFVRLRDTLQQIQGKFLLSMNDRPEVRELFKMFTIETVPTRYFAGNARIARNSRKKPRHELFIHNFKGR